MSFSGFPDVPDDNGEPSTSTLNKTKAGLTNTNRRQKEKLLLAAANQKMKSVVDCSSSSLPQEARLSAPASAISSTVKLKISGI